MMKIKWLGQAGLLFEFGEKKIIVDAYLSDECERVNPASKRRMPIDPSYLSLDPDVVILTHAHMDHTDMPTLERWLSGGGKLVLASESAWEKVRSIGKNNCVILAPGTEWSEGDVVFRAVGAYHSDDTAVGVLINAGDKTFYVTGDTLYNENIFASLPEKLYAVFLPINGRGNNMNASDAARFARKTGARWAIPLHFGMFDSLTGEEFVCENRVIPKIYEYIRFEYENGEEQK